MKILAPLFAVALLPAFAGPASAVTLFDTSNSVDNDADGIADINDIRGENQVTIAVSGDTVVVTGTGAVGTSNGLGSRVQLTGSTPLVTPDTSAGATFELSYDILFPEDANFRRDVAQVFFFDAAGAQLSNPFLFETGTDPTLTDVFQSVSFTGDVPDGTAGVSFRLIQEQSGTDGENGPISATYQNIVVDVTPVPEPASLALLGAGSLALLARRRKTA